jgi:hypothetical protein
VYSQEEDAARVRRVGLGSNVSAHHHMLGASRITPRQLIVLRFDSIRFRNDEPNSSHSRVP